MKQITLARAMLFGLICAPAWGSTIIIGLPSNSQNAFPFGGEVAGAGTRYQQAYASNDFTGLGPITISSIDFLGGAGTLAPSTYSLYFSTITAGIDTLSNTNFNSNLGPDNALFASVVLSGSAPATLTFTGTHFNYNPANGNLLLDVIVSPGGVNANAGFGASYEANFSTSGVFSRYHDFGGGNTGFGLVTQFDYSSAVPEPSTLALAAFAMILGVLLRRRLHLWTPSLNR